MDEKILKQNLDELADSIVSDPERLEEFVNSWSRGFHRYSMYNWMVALTQKKDVSMLASYNKWNKEKRNVKKGERAIYVYAPITWKKQIVDENGEEKSIGRTGFKLVPVFDISQTDGEPIDMGHCRMVKGNSSFQSFANKCPYPINVQDGGLENGSTDGKKINIAKRPNETAMCATLFHEIAHCEMHQNGSRSIPEIMEMEAEAVSFLVCRTFGIENKKSALYLGVWKVNAVILKGFGQRVLKTASKIIGYFEKE